LRTVIRYPLPPFLRTEKRREPDQNFIAMSASVDAGTRKRVLRVIVISLLLDLVSLARAQLTA